jgi:hypothetical protein
MILLPQGLWNIMQDRICYSFCSCNFQTFQNNISDSRCVDAHNQPIMTDSHQWVCLHHFIQKKGEVAPELQILQVVEKKPCELSSTYWFANNINIADEKKKKKKTSEVL